MECWERNCADRIHARTPESAWIVLPFGLYCFNSLALSCCPSVHRPLLLLLLLLRASILAFNCSHVQCSCQFFALLLLLPCVLTVYMWLIGLHVSCRRVRRLCWLWHVCGIVTLSLYVFPSFVCLSVLAVDIVAFKHLVGPPLASFLVLQLLSHCCCESVHRAPSFELCLPSESSDSLSGSSSESSSSNNRLGKYFEPDNLQGFFKFSSIACCSCYCRHCGQYSCCHRIHSDNCHHNYNWHLLLPLDSARYLRCPIPMPPGNRSRIRNLDFSW